MPYNSIILCHSRPQKRTLENSPVVIPVPYPVSTFDSPPLGPVIIIVVILIVAIIMRIVRMMTIVILRPIRNSWERSPGLQQNFVSLPYLFLSMAWGLGVLGFREICSSAWFGYIYMCVYR